MYWNVFRTSGSSKFEIKFSIAVFNILRWVTDRTIEESWIIHFTYNLVTQPSTNPAEQGLILLMRRDAVLALWFRDSTLNRVVYF